MGVTERQILRDVPNKSSEDGVEKDRVQSVVTHSSRTHFHFIYNFSL